LIFALSGQRRLKAFHSLAQGNALWGACKAGWSVFLPLPPPLGDIYHPCPSIGGELERNKKRKQI